MLAERRALLEALGTVLRAHRLAAEMTPDGLRVSNPHAEGGCRTYPTDTITLRARDEDARRLWFSTSWRQPIAEADRVIDAVVAVKGLLGGRSEGAL